MSRRVLSLKLNAYEENRQDARNALPLGRASSEKREQTPVSVCELVSGVNGRHFGP